MPRRNPAQPHSVSAIDVAVTTNAETVIATLPNVNTMTPDENVYLTGWVQLLAGTGTTALTLRIRRGTTTAGTLIGEANAITLAAGDTRSANVTVQDSPGEVAGQSYVLTAQQTGGAADGSALQVALQALIGA